MRSAGNEGGVAELGAHAGVEGQLETPDFVEHLLHQPLPLTSECDAQHPDRSLDRSTLWCCHGLHKLPPGCFKQQTRKVATPGGVAVSGTGSTPRIVRGRASRLLLSRGGTRRNLENGVCKERKLKIDVGINLKPTGSFGKRATLGSTVCKPV